jgi:hypothetical protein
MKGTLLIRFFVLVIFFVALGYRSQATHLRAGEITVERVNCNALTFKITITVFTNTKNTPVKFGGDPDLSYIYFGDGKREYVDEQPNVIRFDLDPSGAIATASYTTFHTYSSFETYKIYYQEPNRNGGVLNMENPLNTFFYIETVINLDLYLDSRGGCSNSPKLLVPPIDRACTGAKWTHNPGAYDPDGDSLAFEMVIPYQDEDLPVVNYRDPNNQDFYANLDYENANEAKNNRPSFLISADTGTITWDAPGAPGEYNIAFIIKEFRKIDGVWYPMGFVRRDMQIIVEDCDNRPPTLEVPDEICVVAGTTIRSKLIGSDPDDHDDSVKIEGFSEIFFLPTALSPAYMIYSPPDTLKPKYEKKPTQNVYFQWATQCNHVKAQPYNVVFKVTDDPPLNKGAKLATFEAWMVRVIGPPPEWTNATLNSGTRSVKLDFEAYACKTAEYIDVYRRVDSFDFTPDECETGLPEFAGYKLIKTLPVQVNGVSTTTFTDNDNGHGLSPGAKYCYRLVVRFPLPRGGESIVSEEICVGPFEVQAPVITNVSVDKTDLTAGEVMVRWTPPFDVDAAAYPPPYQYKVFRGEGFADQTNATLVATLTDTTFIDTNLNTKDLVYNYRIDAYANGGVNGASDFIDSSKVASTVRLEARSLLNKIELNWSAFVPWSNQIDTYPNKHYIYRGPEGSTEITLVELDSIDAKVNGFTFTDGETAPLDAVKYCYRVRTRGGYGNPDIHQPLVNYSQIMCALPGDTIPPCKPLAPVADSAPNCDDPNVQLLLCDKNSFSNTLSWERSENEDCDSDILYYNVWVANSTTGEYVLLKSGIRGTTFTHENLPSYAACYKITAVDQSLNESEPSDPICFDNCPYYELPNIFTPNLDECNGTFSAYSGNDRFKVGNNGEGGAIYKCEGGIAEIDLPRCARFVERVVFKVYNRWGKQVYTYTGASNDDVNTIYIDWDGRADDGSDLTTGIYYYVAEVTFNSVDPNNANKIVKGWVHLLR